MTKFLFVVLVSALAVGCDKKVTNVTGEKGVKPGEAVARPVLTPEPQPAAITAAETSPFDSVKFFMTAKRSANGWPKYSAYNLGTKEIDFLAITAYAYDKDNKQVARTSVPLSWNGKIPSGGKVDWDIEILAVAQVPATATSYELCYASIKFAGEPDMVEDKSRCPEQKPKNQT